MGGDPGCDLFLPPVIMKKAAACGATMTLFIPDKHASRMSVFGPLDLDGHALRLLLAGGKRLGHARG